ncbi:hypothetical protein H6P81_012454 [Aristolochia fimbriata]|uniref:Uncharacterized protein n=1 Tax=Aristolochia fimbriata TaxID=158543 RepID=A0AAV7EEY7_ARIFI|nr:hypothetical protein H6P81_012454 [Aristolochia fimbriata]
MSVMPVFCHFNGEFVIENGYNVIRWNLQIDHTSIWTTFLYNGQLVCTPIYDDISLDGRLDLVKHYFLETLGLFFKRNNRPYEMENRRSLSNEVGSNEGAPVETGEGVLVETIEGAPAERDEGDPLEIDEGSPKEIGEQAIQEFILKEREIREDLDIISSGEDEWADPFTNENVAGRENKTLVPNMRVSHVKEELDEPYPDMWIRDMDTDERYMNTLIVVVNEDNVPPYVTYRLCIVGSPI